MSLEEPAETVKEGRNNTENHGLWGLYVLLGHKVQG